MTLRIPEPYVRAYQWLASLSDDSIKAIESVFSATGESSRRRITRSAAEKSGQPVALVDLLFESMLGLMRTLQDTSLDGISPEEVAEDVSTDPGLELDDDLRQVLRERVARLLQGDPVWRLAKAIDLQADHCNSFRAARIYAEIRPMFGKDISEVPDAASVTHTLKIDFLNRQSDSDSIYIALDDDDILTLHKILEREIQKTKTLERLLASNNIAQMSFSDHRASDEGGEDD